LASWDENFYHPKIGGPSFRNLMLQREVLNDGQVNAYKMGLIDRKYRGLKVAVHAGIDAGYRAYLIRFPELHFSVACLCNAGSSADPVLLSRKVADVFLDSRFRSAHPLPREAYLDLPVEKVASRAGLYWNREINDVMELDFNDGKLSLLDGNELLPLHAITPDVFICEQDGAEIRFEPAGPGGKQRTVVTRSTGESNPYELLPLAEESSSDRVAEFTGDYMSEEIDPVYRLADTSGKLTISWLKHRAQQIKPAGRDLFYNSDLTVHFIRDPQTEAVSGFVLSTGRIQNLRFKKSWTPRK
jgi:hypothetical protein